MKTCPVCNTEYDDANAFCPADGTTLISVDASADLVGSVIADRYLVSNLLGEGGMGRVYLARHVRLPQQAAIKVLHPGMLSDPDAVARFNREAANAARIEHDRVARVFDFGETRSGSVYLAMEYVPGRTLRAILDEEGALPPARAAAITYQVAEGLDAAHRIGIVHRDLKPDNVMVVTDPAVGDKCKVVDFGIAKARDAGTQTRLTRTGTVVGTPEYMSPEQVLGESIEAPSDVYALALVAYHMFTGQLPFQAATPERAFAARLMEDPRPLAVAVPGTEWPAELQQAFDRALDRDPATRTATALEFADAVVAAVEGWQGVSVLRPRTPVSTRSITPRSSAAVGATGAQTAAAPVVVAPRAAAPASTGAAADAAPAANPPARRRTPLLAVTGLVVVAAVAWVATRGGGTAAPAAPVPAVDSGAATATPTAADTAARQAAPPPAPPAPPSTAAAKGTSPQATGSQSALTVPASEPSAGDPGAVAATPPSVRHTLDSLRNVLEDPASGEAEARQAIPALQRVLKSASNATDSTWAWLALVGAHGQVGDMRGACTALRSADKKAATAAQRGAVRQFYDNTSCVP